MLCRVYVFRYVWSFDSRSLSMLKMTKAGKFSRLEKANRRHPMS